MVKFITSVLFSGFLAFQVQGKTSTTPETAGTKLLGFVKALQEGQTYGEVLKILERDGFSPEFVSGMRTQFAQILQKRLPKREISIAENGLPPNAKITIRGKTGTLTINYFADPKSPIKMHGVTINSTDISLADGDLTKKFLTVPFFKKYLDQKGPSSWLERIAPSLIASSYAQEEAIGIFSGTAITGPIPDFVAFMVGGLRGILQSGSQGQESLQLRAPASDLPEPRPYEGK